MKQFVRNGGTLLCTVGALDARGSETLLADFDFRVPHSPVPPGDNAVEPWPLGACTGMFNNGTWQAPFYAAWPVECRGNGQQLVFEEKSKAPIVVARAEGEGVAVVIGDTHFAANANHLRGRGWRPSGGGCSPHPVGARALATTRRDGGGQRQGPNRRRRRR